MMINIYLIPVHFCVSELKKGFQQINKLYLQYQLKNINVN